MPRKIAVVTTFSPKGFCVYGRKMLEDLDKFWPKDIPVYVFYEAGQIIPPDFKNKRFIWFSLDWCEDRKKFIESHTDHPSNYRKMPIKFCHKIFALTEAPRHTDWLIWLDGDIETVRPVTQDLLDSVLPDDVVASYLGRRWWAHTEAGFLAYRLSDIGRQFLDDLRAVYTTDKLMELAHLHDCAAFDYVRQIYEGKGHKFLDLGEQHRGPGLDVMGASVLGSYMMHNKGLAAKQRAYGAVA